MKLYAIRDKKSGTFWEYDDVADDFELSSTWATAWQIKEDVFGPEYIADWAKRKNVEVGNLEYVTFREEPTKPCKWCGDITTEGKISRLTDEIIEEEGIVTLLQTTEKTLPMFEWKFCPNCGRSLT